MLDVHPAHQAASTWRDFFIHIATIVVGLLIAIGLEQTVEYFHRVHQLHVAREQLGAEQEANRTLMAENLSDLQRARAELEQDMLLLRAHQAGSPLTARLDYSWTFNRPPDAAWQAVRDNGSLSLLPYDELKLHVHFYEVLASVVDAASAWNMQMHVAAEIAARSPDGSLSPHDTDELISATSDAKGKLDFTIRLLTFENHALHALE